MKDFFKILRKSPKKKRSNSVETPYMRARQEWSDRIGNLVQRTRNWRLTAILALLVSLISLTILVIFLKENRVHLFVLEVGEKGRVINLAPLQRSYQPSEAQKEYFLKNFIDLFRSVSLDPVLTKKNLLAVYKFAGQKAQDNLTNIIRNENIIKMIGKVTRSVKIKAINSLTENSFQIEWSEEEIDLKKNLRTEKIYSGFFTIVIIVPKTQEELLSNPLGIFIVDFKFSPQVDQ